MNHNINVAVIGGDSRQIHMGMQLRKYGYRVRFTAFEHGSLPFGFENYTLADAISQSEILVFPLPVSRDGKNLNASFAKDNIPLQSVLQKIGPHCKVFCGMPPVFFEKTLEAHGIKVTDYFKNEELTLKNAVLTAEGVIGILTQQIPVTIFKMRCAVTGYGRVARYTAKALRNLGADVTVFARSANALTGATCDFIKAVPLSQFKERIADFDCIINTVPQQIIDEESILQSSPDCVFIEVASAPYGMDSDVLLKNNRKHIKAVSLPGKTAPKTAGVIIADTIHNHLTEGFI